MLLNLVLPAHTTGVSTHEASRSRQPQGQPIGGQFAAEHKPASGLILDEADPDKEVTDYLEGLGLKDRRLAEILLDPANDPYRFGDETRADRMDHFSSFGSHNATVGLDNASTVGGILSHHYGDDVFFEYDYDNWTISSFLSSHEAYLSTSHELRDITDDREASGISAALAYARAIDTEMRDVRSKRDKLAAPATAPTMVQMRAAVQVDDWRGKEASVRFVDDYDGQIGEERSGVIRSGRWTPDGQIAPAEVPDGHEHVRLTMMDTGVDRFMPFTEVSRMVTEHRIAEK